MKLTRILMVLGVLLLAVGLMTVPPVIQATEGMGAVVYHDGSCYLGSIVSGLGVDLGPAEQTGYQKVVTPSGNVKLTCHFAIPEGYWPMTSIVNGGFACNINTPDGSISTEDTQSVASSEGGALLRCMYKAPKE